MATEDFDILQQGSSLPYGSGTQLEDQAAAIEESVDTASDIDILAEAIDTDEVDDDLFTDDEDIDEPQERLQGTDALLFAPTQRPDQPVTAGAPVGPGAPFVRPSVTPEQFIRSFSQRLTSSAASTDDVKAWAQRKQSGQ